MNQPLAEHLQPFPTDLLIAIALGKVDAQHAAALTMANRGLDQNGKWVGFPEAAKAWGITQAA